MTRALALIAALGGWHLQAAGAVVAAPVARAHMVFIGDTRGDLYALDETNGHVRLHLRLPGGIWSPPALEGGLAIVGAGSPRYLTYAPPVYALAGPGINRVTAVGDDGTERWAYGVAGSATSALAIVDGLAILHDGGGEIVARDARTGAYRWRRFLGSAATLSGAVAVGEGRIATSGAYPNEVAVLRVRDGRLLARVALPRDAAFVGEEPLAFGDRAVYGIYFRAAGRIAHEHLYAVDIASGTLRFDREIDAGPVALPTRVTYAAGALLVGSPFAARVASYAAADGTLRWSAGLAGRSLGGAAIRGGVAYLGDASGTLSALDLRDGRAIGGLRIGGVLAGSTPAALSDCVAIGSASGRVTCVPYARLRGASP